MCVYVCMYMFMWVHIHSHISYLCVLSILGDSDTPTGAMSSPNIWLLSQSHSPLKGWAWDIC